MFGLGFFVIEYLIIGVGFLLQCVSGLAINPPSGVVVAPMWKRNQNDKFGDSQLRRRNNPGTPLVPLVTGDHQTLYFANISIGTPPQKLSLQIDTGSTDIWVQVDYSNACQNLTDPCLGGTYANSTSSSYRYVSSEFRVDYVDETYAAGDYGSETFNIGGVKVTDVQFGIAVEATTPVGILGVGFQATEGTSTLYPTLLDQMVSQGLIRSRAYSLYLNDLEAQAGHILFGGVDTEKFYGNLSTLPMNHNITGQSSRFLITLTGLSLSPPTGPTIGVANSNNYPINVLLDSGATFCVLPHDIVQALAKATGAIYYPSVEVYLLQDCSEQYAQGTINFFFSGVEINVPYDQFIVRRTRGDGTGVCILGVIEGTSHYTLGDSFLRSAYVVYDLDNQEISIANAKFDVSASNIRPILSGTNNVPSATRVQNPTTLLDDERPNLAGTATGLGGAIPTKPPGASATNIRGARPTNSGVLSLSAANAIESISLWGFGASSFVCVVLGAWLIS